RPARNFLLALRCITAKLTKAACSLLPRLPPSRSWRASIVPSKRRNVVSFVSEIFYGMLLSQACGALAPRRIYVGRVAGGHRHHRSLGRDSVARGPGGPRSGPPHVLPE